MTNNKLQQIPYTLVSNMSYNITVVTPKYAPTGFILNTVAYRLLKLYVYIAQTSFSILVYYLLPSFYVYVWFKIV